MASTVAIQQDFKNEGLVISRTLTVAAGVTIPEGTLVSINGSGEAIVGVTSARIAGVAQATKTAGEVVTCYFNHVHKLILSGAAATAIGTAAYAADNNTVTLTPNTAILGPVVDIDTNAVYVQLTTRA